MMKQVRNILRISLTTSIFLLLALVLQTTILTRLHADASLTKLGDTVKAPDFELVTLDGDQKRLADYAGKPLIINFWATWCPPCREELPAMNRAWRKIKNQDIAMIAVNVGEDEDTIFEFTADYPIDFDVLLDKSGDIINQWPVKGLPTTFVVTPEGNLAYRAIGGREWDDDALLDKVRALKTDPTNPQKQAR